MGYIRNALIDHFAVNFSSLKALKGLKILDVGCGGGISSEPMARMGGKVTGIDSSKQLIQVAKNHSEKMTSFRRDNIGYVFQFFNLLQDLTVMENILLIQELAGKKNPERAKELLNLVGLNDEMNRFPGEISGGQQQRVAIARSIAKKPTLLLGDELTGNLDTETSKKVMEVLVEACAKENITAIFVTHDESLIQYATRVIRIDSGLIISDEKHDQNKTRTELSEPTQSM